MRQKIEAQEGFGAISSTGDGLGLLRALKGVAYQFQSQKYLLHSLQESMKRYYNCSQGKFATTQAYLEHFQNMVDVVVHSGGQIAGHPGVRALIMAERGSVEIALTAEQRAEIELEVTSRSTAIIFLMGCDRTRYGKLIEDLENDFLTGAQQLSLNTAAAYNLLTNWKQDNRHGWRPPSSDAVSFANVDGPKKARNKAHITCHKCAKMGHYASECPDLAAERAAANVNEGTLSGATLLTAGITDGDFDEHEGHFQFLQSNGNGITCQIGQDGRLPRTWILLDNQSTVDVFYNRDLLTNIREGTSSMDIHCNAGVASTNLEGELAGYGTVWYHPNGIANILSLSRMKEHGHRVTYDSHDGNKFTVHKQRRDGPRLYRV
jgi:hypothetical protein